MILVDSMLFPFFGLIYKESGKLKSYVDEV